MLAQAWASGAAGQVMVDEMPMDIAPIDGAESSWHVIAAWAPTEGTRVLLEARRRAPGDPARLTARVPSDEDGTPADGTDWALDASRTALREWTEPALTMTLRVLPDGRLLILWSDLRFDGDDDAGVEYDDHGTLIEGFRFGPSAALLLTWTAPGPVTVAGTWRSSEGAAPDWVTAPPARAAVRSAGEAASAAIAAGSFEEAERWIDRLGQLGEQRLAREIRRELAGAEEAARRRGREELVRTAIDEGRLEDAERELTALERDRGARALVRSLRSTLRAARAAADRARESTLAASVATQLTEQMAHGDVGADCSRLVTATFAGGLVSLALRRDPRLVIRDPEHCMMMDLMNTIVFVLRTFPDVRTVRATFAEPIENRYGEETGLRITLRAAMTRESFDRVEDRWLRVYFHGHLFGWTIAAGRTWDLMQSESAPD